MKTTAILIINSTWIEGETRQLSVFCWTSASVLPKCKGIIVIVIMNIIIHIKRTGLAIRFFYTNCWGQNVSLTLVFVGGHNYVAGPFPQHLRPHTGTKSGCEHKPTSPQGGPPSLQGATPTTSHQQVGWVHRVLLHGEASLREACVRLPGQDCRQHRSLVHTHCFQTQERVWRGVLPFLCSECRHIHKNPCINLKLLELRNQMSVNINSSKFWV